MIFQQFYPDEYRPSVYKMDFSEYYDKGFRGIIFDIDNTLVEHDEPADRRAVRLIRKLKHMGFRCLILSNNDEERVRSFSTAAGALYIHKAGKPGRTGYYRAMDILGTDEDTTMFIGDQLFTDIWGARRSGIYSVLVHPIARHEEIQIILKRRLERIVLWFYFRDRHKNPLT